MKNTAVWLLIIGIGLLLGVWSLSFWAGGCSSILQPENLTTTTTTTGNASTTTTIYYSAEYAYVAGQGPFQIIIEQIDQSSGALVSLESFSTMNIPPFQSINTTIMNIDSSHQFLFASGNGALGGTLPVMTGGILVYRMGAPDALTLLTAKSMELVRATAVDPSGQFIYIIHDFVKDYPSPYISVYKFDAVSQSLSLVETKEAAPPPSIISIDPAGKFVYAVNSLPWNGQPSPDTITVYSIDNLNGKLTLVQTAEARLALWPAFSSRPGQVTFHPSGKFAYVNKAAGDNINFYTVDPSTGKLTFVEETASGLYTDSICIHPSGEYLYAANVDAANISIFRIDQSSGSLSRVTDEATGMAPGTLSIDPAGKFIYEGNSIYSIDAATGRISYKAPTLIQPAAFIGIK